MSEWLIDIIKEWVIAQAYATEAWVLGKLYATEAWVLEWITPYNVTGDINPDATCTYHKAGTYNTKPYYKRQDGAYFLWWAPIVSSWIISQSLGHYASNAWGRPEPIVGNYAPIAPATGLATVSEGRKYLCHGFVDRGDPAAQDFTLVFFTQDNAWHDIDLSAIAPAGAKAVSLSIIVTSQGVGRSIKLRTKSNINDKNISSVFGGAVGVPAGGDYTCPLDESRFLQYKMLTDSFTFISFTVKGWWY